jgi:hypothetical protein
MLVPGVAERRVAVADMDRPRAVREGAATRDHEVIGVEWQPLRGGRKEAAARSSHAGLRQCWVEVALEAAKRSGRRIKIVGTGPELASFR